jgi:hypothetical protein
MNDIGLHGIVISDIGGTVADQVLVSDIGLHGIMSSEI